jgi:2-desacetyl-2-hydroxyethyl bacteriochlorophyllide A dehydrogenase
MVKAVILQRPGTFQLVDVPVPPPPRRDEVQVRVRRIGICGTDLHAFTESQPFFSYPRILGHELAVEVLRIGSTSVKHHLIEGRSACLRPYLNCGICGACRRGLSNCCSKMQVLGVHLDGGMRELINVPLNTLHVSDQLADDSLALVEMLSIGTHAVRRAQISPGEVALVIGSGPIGLGVAQFAHLAHATVIAMDVSDARLAFARRQPYVAHVIDAKHDVREQLRAIIPDDLPTVVFDATGNAKSMMHSFDYVAHGGRLVFVGLFQGNITFNDPEFHRRELSLLASRNATPPDFEIVIDALERGKVEVQSLITHRVSVEEMVEQFSHWLDPANGVMKALVHL